MPCPYPCHSVIHRMLTILGLQDLRELIEYSHTLVGWYGLGNTEAINRPSKITRNKRVSTRASGDAWFSEACHQSVLRLHLC